MTSARIRPLPLAGLASACAAALLVAYVTLVRTDAGQRLDQRALDSRALAAKPARYAIHTLLTTISVGMLVVVFATLVGVAIVRRRPALALVAGATIAGAAVLTEVLKHVLERPTFVFGEPFGNTFPSGHTTVAFAVGVAATLVAPPHLRRLVGAGAALYGAAVGIAVVAADWHRPSDVAGAFLVVTGWAAVVALVAALRFPGLFSATPPNAEPRLDETAIQPRHLLFGALALIGAYVALLTAVLVRRGGEIHWTLPGNSFLAASAALAVLAAVAIVALLGALQRAIPDNAAHESAPLAMARERS